MNDYNLGLTQEERRRVHEAAKNAALVPMKQPARIEAMAIREVVYLATERSALIIEHANDRCQWLQQVRSADSQWLSAERRLWEVQEGFDGLTFWGHVKYWWNRRTR